MQATDQKSFFDQIDIDRECIAIAQRRYPFSNKHGRLRGNGRYVLIAKCTVPWRISLYPTAQQRADTVDKWNWNGCGSARCSHNHVCENLEN